ncbi:MAG: transposase [Methylococcales bacterium]
MTTTQPTQSKQKPKSEHFAGIDVGAEELVLAIRKKGKPFDTQQFANIPADRTRPVKKLIKLPNILVCLEATGIYHFDLAIALHDAGVLLMVVNPKASHNFEPPAHITATQDPPKAVLCDAKLAISQLKKRIGCLTADAAIWIEKHPELKRVMALLVGIKGIAQTSGDCPDGGAVIAAARPIPSRMGKVCRA